MKMKYKKQLVMLRSKKVQYFLHSYRVSCYSLPYLHILYVQHLVHHKLTFIISTAGLQGSKSLQSQTHVGKEKTCKLDPYHRENDWL